MNRKHTYHRLHKGRKDLTGEHTIGDAGQAIIGFLFAFVWISDTHFYRITTGLSDFISPYIRMPCGIILLILSAYLAMTGLYIVFIEKREKPVVIRKGVFNLVRHPIYLSEVLLYLGFFIFSLSLAALCVLIMAILFLYYLSRYEEKLLLARFGESYKKYMQEVGMWIPRFCKR